MARLPKESIVEYKEIYKKQYGKELSDSDAQDQANRLVGLFDLLFKCAEKELIREKKLKKEPDGFPVDGDYNCRVCGNHINPQTGWYHKGGARCFPCHQAVLNGTVPSFVFKNDKSYFRTWYLAHCWNKRMVSIRKMVREGKLKARDILNDQGKIHEQIFLKKENPSLVERYSPERKSWDRNREKVAKAHSRKLKEEFRKEREKTNKKIVEMRKRHSL